MVAGALVKFGAQRAVTTTYLSKANSSMGYEPI
jgi:hypothetical protein